MSQWSQPVGNQLQQNSDSPAPSSSPPGLQQRPDGLTSAAAPSVDSIPDTSPTQPSRSRTSRPNSRPTSLVQTFQPALMEVAQDTLPELQPIFTLLNSHSNKLYQEGYFLKLHDLDSRGRPSGDRNWQECFAQLVGTILSLWDATQLDAAGENGEVVPTFINLADASIKMIESLIMDENSQHFLQNVLSISTAANNRYLLHFNSLNSLTQWTAGIRLAMYEHATLQEAYTGSLIAGKGKLLNNIRQIMERTRFKYEDWTRVRFGAGTPWRRCWFVISQPDEKEYQKMQKSMKKKAQYEKMPILKGDLKFYETKKITKKTKPIATITDAYSAYSIYPQSKPLIDQSTLIKIEGQITIHSSPEKTTEGFVFVMPEAHPAVPGFEMMLRFLFPVWDTFALYGRPTRLIADVLDARGLMFALPKDRKYGYLELLDVSGLIHSEGSADWSEHRWRKEMKNTTSKRMLAMSDEQSMDDAFISKSNSGRTSLPSSRNGRLRFEDAPSGRSTPGVGSDYRGHRRAGTLQPPEQQGILHHRRSASEALTYKSRDDGNSAEAHDPYRHDDDSPPPPPPHGQSPYSQAQSYESLGEKFDTASEGSDKATPDSEKNAERSIPPEVHAMAASSPPPAPVAAPPVFVHAPSEKPVPRPNAPVEMRRGHSDLDGATLSQLAEATKVPSPFASPGSRGNDISPAQGLYSTGSGDRDHWRGHINAAASGDVPYNQQYQAPMHPSGRYSGTRLPTIPASPYVDPPVDPNGGGGSPVAYFGSRPPAAQPYSSQSEQADSSQPRKQSFQPQRAEIPQAGTMSPPRPPPIVRTDSGSIVQRKPLPRSQSSTESQESSRPSTASGSQAAMYGTDVGGRSRDVTPESQRTGKLRSIGNSPQRDLMVGDARYSPGRPNKVPNSEVPDANSGPTYAVDSGSRNGPPIPRRALFPLSVDEGTDISPRSTPMASVANQNFRPPSRPDGFTNASQMQPGYQHGGNQAPTQTRTANRIVPAYSQSQTPQGRPVPSPQNAPHVESHQGIMGQTSDTSEAITPEQVPASLAQYSGQYLPVAQVQAMRARDLELYGPQHVRKMERMAPVSSFRRKNSERSNHGDGPQSSWV